MTTLLLYGDAKAIEIAERMIQEAADNREQKKQQREKEYARKREEKARNRQLYYLRHTRVGCIGARVLHCTGLLACWIDGWMDDNAFKAQHKTMQFRQHDLRHPEPYDSTFDG
jgi:hypothetical protein